MTIRIFPPLSGSKSHTTFGRQYDGWAVSYLDVPDQDAATLSANGWLAVAPVGATSARPANPARGAEFLDTTLGYIIKFDGIVWRNPASGAAV